MAFLKYARANVVRPHITGKAWSAVRTARVNNTKVTNNIVEQASQILGKPFSPENYLLTHCSIVASVDVETVPNIKLGNIEDGGTLIRREFPNYRITKDTEKYINHNFDAFPRDALIKGYTTFIGAHNFVEHVQIEEHSKGRVIDAVARDIGDSIYIDILVATDRKHAELVDAIESGEMSTLSMGCSVDACVCTKCGNVATDDTTVCKCIKYEKGNVFYDETGTPRIIAETCGHSSLDPHAGITFIEASWVKTPAFTGAVMRNILQPSQVTQKVARKAEDILSQPPTPWVAPSAGIKKFARGFGGGGDEEAAAAPAAPAKSPLEQLEDQVLQAILDKVKVKIETQLSAQQAVEAPPQQPSPEESTVAPNDNVIKQAYLNKVSSLLRTANSKLDFIVRLAAHNERSGIFLDTMIYRTAATVSYSNTKSLKGFVALCNKVAGKKLSINEVKQILKIAKLLSLRSNLA